ncbi:hypothetical protein AAYS49_002245 [Salmonella enterica]|nr:hypothetical protein [Salmonella enterica subsp. enterica serovar Miami]ELQ5083021.1 hypothetical protein [Salmonella enterica]
MSLDLSFFILYLFSSLILFALRFWICFFIYPVGGLTSHLVCRAANFGTMAIQTCLAVTGHFPFNVLASQVRWNNDMVRALALILVAWVGWTASIKRTGSSPTFVFSSS